MNVVQSFVEQWARVPGKIALVRRDERVAYGTLGSQVRSLAVFLRANGIGHGDRVVVFLDSSIEFAVAVHAVLAVGAAFVPISALVKADKLAYVLDDTEAAAMLTHTRSRHVWADALMRATQRPLCVVAGLAAPDETAVVWPPPDDRCQLPVATATDDELAAIIYTSGTTGVPKGVMLSHRNMCSAWESVQSYLELQEHDVIGLALSPAFSYGLYYLLIGLGLGATVVLEPAAALPAAVIDMLARERVKVFPGVPTLFSSLLGHASLRDADLSALRLVTNAAASMPEALTRRLRQAWPQARLFLMYGMTECKRISYLPAEMVDVRPNSVGRGVSGQEHWLVDERGARLPAGATGELVASGNHVMLGYWRKPIETAESLKPGRGPRGVVLHTGDIFRTDPEGWLYFLSRRDDMIKSRGEKVAPREVEDVICELQGVRECAVAGVADEHLGQRIKAWVVLEPGAIVSERQVIRHCLARLENYMAPGAVAFVSELPRTDSGKILKTGLL